MFRTTNPTVAWLAELSVLGGLRGRERRSVAHHFDPITVEAGTELIRQDSLNRHTYLVVDGRLEVEVDGMVIATVGADDVVGEGTLLGGVTANATVRAVETTKVLAIDHRAMLALGEQHPDIAERLVGLAEARAAA